MFSGPHTVTGKMHTLKVALLCVFILFLAILMYSEPWASSHVRSRAWWRDDAHAQ